MNELKYTYEVFSAPDPDRFAKIVTNNLNKGWDMHGFQFPFATKYGMVVLCQGMIKEENAADE